MARKSFWIIIYINGSENNGKLLERQLLAQTLGRTGKRGKKMKKTCISKDWYVVVTGEERLGNYINEENADFFGNVDLPHDFAISLPRLPHAAGGAFNGYFQGGSILTLVSSEKGDLIFFVHRLLSFLKYRQMRLSFGGSRYAFRVCFTQKTASWYYNMQIAYSLTEAIV